MGPYSNPCCEIKRESCRGNGLINSENEAAAVKLAGRLKIISRNQAEIAIGINGEKLGRVFKRLWGWGYLDRLTSGATPPLYVLGPEGRKALQAPREEWDALRAFRLVMANQLHLRLPQFDYEPEPGPGVTGLLKLNGVEYPVYCPRLGDEEWCKVVTDLLPEKSRPVIVAATKEMAVKLAKVIRFDLPARFVWDDLLADSEFCFYRREKGVLVPAEKNILVGRKNC
ncbi:hypothetical protein SDD30_15200 [Moorella naiadis]|uniref:hypothetical protein n=1 Tax=Moorella naiadis (nom. illeg.) TaxID=3093670 RepID=UPI003D9CB6BF